MTTRHTARHRGYLLGTFLIGCTILLSFAAFAGAALARGSGSARTNRAIASDTKKLEGCLRVNRSHPGKCADAQHALARATRAKRRHLRSAQARRDTPPVTGAGSSASKSATAPTVSGPAGAPSLPGNGSSPTEKPSEPPARGAPASATFQPGINSGSAAIWELPGAMQVGAKVVRVEMAIAESVQQIEPIIAAYAEKGIRVALLAGFEGRLPTPAEALNLASWARAFGPGGTYWADHPGGRYAIQTIEFGNETSFGYQYKDDSPAGYASRARGYARRVAEAAVAIRAVNASVGLLAQGDSGNAGPSWVKNMFRAVPNLGALVSGWSVHPYGPNWRVKFDEIVSQTAARGAPSTIPIDVTEWGLSTDNGRCLDENYGWNVCMSYQEAAAVLSRTVSEMRQALNGRLGLMLLYTIRDQRPTGESTNREYYFGALQRELQPKGAYTVAVESLLASS